MIRRSAWVDTAHPVTGPKSDLTKIDAIVIHYPGVNPGALNLANPVQVLRSTHLFYLSKKPTGYAIGYNFATFPSGRFELRGFDIKNAANKGHNDHTISINCMVNGADPMPESQLEYTREMVQEIWDALGRQVPLIRHRDLSGAATACPGAGITAQLSAGLLLPPATKPPPETPEQPPTEDDDMTTAYIWRDARFKNSWLCGVGAADHLTPASRDTLVGQRGIVEIVEVHDLKLKQCLNQSGLDLNDLVPV